MILRLPSTLRHQKSLMEKMKEREKRMSLLN